MIQLHIKNKLTYKNKKILFFNLEHFDYLSDSILIGLKSIEEIDVYEFSGNKFIYKFTDAKKTHGLGFTLKNTVNPLKQKIHNSNNDINGYDIYIISSIQHQYYLLNNFRNILSNHNTIILDGSDSSSLFPFNSIFYKEFFKLNLVFNRFTYFKREFVPQQSFFKCLNSYVPNYISRILEDIILKISFSIPEEKIINYIPEKVKLFPKHIIDNELIPYIEGSQSSYAFKSEQEYYNDLQISKFGITSKRAGWDCMRHYEIAANGAVICFKDLSKKSSFCAPHGLLPGVNCIEYFGYQDLITKISRLSENEYSSLQKNSLEWVKSKSSRIAAKSLLNSFYNVQN